MTPDTPVWISTARSGIAYHRIDGRKTLCGRYLGTDAEPRGHVLPMARAVEEFGSQLCRACDGSSTPPVVVPGRDRFVSGGAVPNSSQRVWVHAGETVKPWTS